MPAAVRSSSSSRRHYYNIILLYFRLLSTWRRTVFIYSALLYCVGCKCVHMRVMSGCDYLPNAHAAVTNYNCTQQVSETRNRLNGVKLLVPVIADRECDVVPCTPREGFARGDWGEICRKSVLSHPRLPVRMPVAARIPSRPRSYPRSRFTFSARSHPLRTAARNPPPRSPARPLGHRCV